MSRANGSVARVAKHYDATVAHEAQRLGENAYRRLEIDMTLRTIARHVPPGARLLDIGGGPGTYLAPLTTMGYDAWLCDLSRANVRVARERAAALGLSRPTARARHASATDLGAYAGASFDAALVAGPFYHLVDPADQARAIREVARVVRPGGAIVLAILPRLHPLRYLLREGDRRSWRELERLDWDRLLASGKYEQGDGDFFTDAFLWDVGEFRGFIEKNGLIVTDTLSVESFAAFMDVPFEAWAKSPARYRRLLDLVEATARHPDQIGAAEHLLVVARAP